MKVITFFFLFLCALSLSAQIPIMEQSIFSQYERFREASLEDRRFKHPEVRDLVLDLQGQEGFEVEELGRSMEGREIFLIKIGTGETPVLLWSQMHGDEATATQALFDFFNFLKDPGEFKEFRDDMLSKVTIWAVPMLNPDGAERFQRRNALGIDLNRDALRLQTPEAQILKSARDRSQAQWGFNLHDQSRSYRAGFAAKPATLSFLAPAYDYERSINPSRADAMRLIGLLSKELNTFIPQQIARYDDSFEPRAFGDNIQKWGTRTILVESGGFVRDREKQYIRKLNFFIFLRGIGAIASGEYNQQGVLTYEKLPFNQSRMFDLLLRNVRYVREGKSYVLDVAVNLREVDDASDSQYHFRAGVADLGDLSTYNGYQEIPARNLEIAPGMVFPKLFKDLQALEEQDLGDLLKQGYLYIRLKKLPPEGDFTHLPINLIGRNTRISSDLKLGGHANFILKREGEVQQVILNGQLFDQNIPKLGIMNGAIYR